MSSAAFLVNNNEKKERKSASGSLLTSGYIRSIEKLLNNNQIIPNSICFICFKYYYCTNRIIWISPPHAPTINCSLHIADIDTNLNWYSNIDISVNDTEAICYAENIKLSTKLLSDHNINHNQCNGIIHFTATNKKNQLIIFDDSQLHAQNYQIKAHKFELPKYPINGVQQTTLLYSNIHGIVTIGGSDSGTKCMYHLNTDMDWKWNQLENMNESRFAASCTVIDENKYFVFGGYGRYWLNTAEMYECETNKWISLSNAEYKRCYNGIYNDSINDIVYIGGGNNNDYIDYMEYFDLNKNKWYKVLPRLSIQQGFKPIIWKENHLLYVVSCVSNSLINYIDLRINNVEWQSKSLLGVFDGSIDCMLKVDSIYGISKLNQTHRMLNLK